MSIDLDVAIDQAIDRLNEMLLADPAAIHALIEHAVPCNQSLADHPTCQVWPVGDGHEVRMLGVINGMFGCDDDDVGYICARIEDGKISRFERTPVTRATVGYGATK